MNSQEAREILLLYRGGNREPDEPEMAQALALLKTDKELALWFEEHRAFQEALQSKFSQIAVPEGLREQILSERKARTSFGPKPKAALLALAVACILVLVGLANLYFQPREDGSFSTFRGRMASKIVRGYPTMDLETNDLKQIRQFLAKKGAHGNYVLPKPLEKVPATGCAVLAWQGKTVSMVCFNFGQNGSTNSPDLFLFIVDRADVKRSPDAKSPDISQINRLETASWSSGDKSYLLATVGDEGSIRKFVRGLGE